MATGVQATKQTRKLGKYEVALQRKNNERLSRSNQHVPSMGKPWRRQHNTQKVFLCSLQWKSK